VTSVINNCRQHAGLRKRLASSYIELRVQGKGHVFGSNILVCDWLLEDETASSML